MEEDRDSLWLKFGSNLIDMTNVAGLSFKANPLSDDFFNDDNNVYYYFVTTKLFDGTEINYNGNKNDLYEFMLSLEKYEIINSDNIKSFKKFVERLEQDKNDYNKILHNAQEKEEKNAKNRKKSSENDDYSIN